MAKPDEPQQISLAKPSTYRELRQQVQHYVHAIRAGHKSDGHSNLQITEQSTSLHLPWQMA